MNEPSVLTHDFALLPELLKDEGYSTVGLGKWHLGLTEVADIPSNRGFDKYFGNLQGAGDYFLHEAGMLCNSANPITPDQYPGSWGSNCLVKGYDLNFNGAPVLTDDSGELYRGQYYTDVLATKATQFINEHNVESPLFLYLAPTAPHAPLQVTDEYLSVCEHITTDNYRNVLCAMMAGLDSMIGDVLGALEAKDMLDNTLIAFISDNGGVSQYGSKNMFKGDKGSIYDGGVRVPAFLTGNIKNSLKGTSYDGLVHANDMFATLARAGGVDESIIAVSEGFPILHKNMHKIDNQFNREVVYLGLAGDLYGETGGVVFLHNGHHYKWTRFPLGFSYVVGYASSEFIRGETDGDFFFDLTVDPQETTNLINDPAHAALVAMGRTFTFADRDAGKPSATTARYLTESTSEKGCWLPRGSPYEAVDCGIIPVPFPNPTNAPFPFFPVLNQFVYRNAGLALQEKSIAAQQALVQLLGSTAALLQQDAAPCTPERAMAKGAVAVALQAVQSGIAYASTLTPGSPAFAQQQQVVQGLVVALTQKLSLYFAESSCGGNGLAPAVAVVQAQVVAALTAYGTAANAAMAAQANFVMEGQVCGCTCGINCPPASLAANGVVSLTHEHPDLRITSEDIMNGKLLPDLFYD